MLDPLEDILPLEEIRQHTKTDDIPHVTDALLRRYRAAAFEAAQQHTGLSIGERWVEQSAAFNRSDLIGGYASILKPHRVRLNAPADQGVVYLVGRHQTQEIRVEKGARHVDIQPLSIDLSGDCCSPCGSTQGPGDILRYQTGKSCGETLPAGVIMGVLKLMAWHVMNAGDEILTTRNRESMESGTMQGSNDAVVLSGALDEWRRYRRVA